LTTSSKIMGTYDDYEKKLVFPRDNHVFTKRFYRGRKSISVR